MFLVLFVSGSDVASAEERRSLQTGRQRSNVQSVQNLYTTAAIICAASGYSVHPVQTLWFPGRIPAVHTMIYFVRKAAVEWRRVVGLGIAACEIATPNSTVTQSVSSCKKPSGTRERIIVTSTASME